MSFPGAIASFLGFTSSHTLAADSHAAQHNSEQTEIVATQTKIGTGSSTPTSGLLLRGTGAGTSSWAQANLTSDVTGVLPQANGGTGTTLATGTGKVVYDTSPTISGAQLTSSPSITTPTITTPTIADFTNANHNHQNTAGGGTLNAATALQSGSITASRIGTDSSFALSSFTPVYSAASGVLTSATGTMKYIQLGKLVFWYLDATITNAGTGAAAFLFTLPIAALNTTGYLGAGREDVATGNSLNIKLSNATTGSVTYYNNTHPMATNNILRMNGFYEVS